MSPETIGLIMDTGTIGLLIFAVTVLWQRLNKITDRLIENQQTSASNGARINAVSNKVDQIQQIVRMSDYDNPN